MNIDDSRLIALFQRLTTELLIEKRLGRRRPELTDELYKAWREVEQRGLNRTPAYRNLLSRADRHALWLAGLVMPQLLHRLSLRSRQFRPTVHSAAALRSGIAEIRRVTESRCGVAIPVRRAVAVAVRCGVGWNVNCAPMCPSADACNARRS